MENRIVNLDSIDAYNRLYGFTTRHPLVTVVDLKDASQLVNHIRINYGVYALFLKNGVNCTIKYGRKTYDYQEGTIVSFSPGQVIDVEMLEGETSADVIGLLFHPDLIYGTPLGEKIASFNFFDYSQMEALHLSESERKIYLDCLQKIDMELEHPVDSHSASVLSANIQLLLEYLHRFYDRQFITRHKVNSEIVAQFERRLKEYYDAGSTNDSIPTVAEFAEKANLTPKYFSDLVKRETGMTPKTLIMRRMIDVAKHRLAISTDDISVIAYELGFQYPAHFTRMFKRATGQSPTDYRRQMEQN
ncbi:MAG: helix-turn-helix domain-containing protein [Duncaniella sp.]|nr:helix-turn-helix domain-containing protein [Duncaniella sp.]